MSPDILCDVCNRSADLYVTVLRNDEIVQALCPECLGE